MELGQILKYGKIQEKDLSVYQHVFITLKLLLAHYQLNQHFTVYPKSEGLYQKAQ